MPDKPVIAGNLGADLPTAPLPDEIFEPLVTTAGVRIERIVSTVFDEVTEALVRGDRVELRGFGAFSVRHRGSRVGRNPRTGEKVTVPDKVVPYFKTGKGLRERPNTE